MGTKTRAYFGVFDFGDDAEAVSSIMGVQPTEAWIKGAPYASKSPNARRTHSRWVLSSGVDEAKSVEDHLAALLPKLESMKSQVERVKQKFSARIGVAQYIHEVNPQFELEADILTRIAKLGLSIWFDQYCLGED